MSPGSSRCCGQPQNPDRPLPVLCSAPLIHGSCGGLSKYRSAPKIRAVKITCELAIFKCNSRNTAFSFFTVSHVVIHHVVHLREKFAPGPGFKLGSTAVRTCALPTAPPKRITEPSQKCFLTRSHYPPAICPCLRRTPMLALT